MILPNYLGSKLSRAFALMLVFCLFPVQSIGQVDTFEFENPEQQRRFRQLSDELRCPMCQNTNLTGSTGGVAEDLRREIHRMIIEGMSDQEIEQFMFERYGDFIFYRPRFRADTVIVWLGPLVFFLVGIFIARNIWRRASTLDTGPDRLPEVDEQRLKELLDESH